MPEAPPPSLPPPPTDAAAHHEHKLDNALKRLQRGASTGRRGLVWTATLRLAVQGVQFLGVVILARLVDPEDYGRAAIVLAFTGLAFFVNEMGVTVAIVAAPRVTEGLLAAAFAISALAGLILFGAFFALAPHLANWYGDPELVTLLLVGASGFVLSQAPMPMGLLLRASRLRAIGVIELAGALVGLCTSLSLVVAGVSGALALVLAPVVSSIVVTVSALMVVRILPLKHLRFTDTRQLLSYSSNVFAFDALNYGSQNVDRPLLGLQMSLPDLGHYSRAYSLVAVPANILALTLGRSLFPALARAREDSTAIRRLWLRYLRFAAASSTVIAVPLILHAEPILVFVLGEDWRPAAPYLITLSFILPGLAIRSVCVPAFQALGGVAKQLRTGLVALLSMLILVGTGLRFDVNLAVAAVPLATSLAAGYAIWQCAPLLAVKKADIAGALLWIPGCALPLVGADVSISMMTNGDNLARLVTSILVAGAILSIGYLRQGRSPRGG
jgi:O-antigen/teichoic acid export membrane protein